MLNSKIKAIIKLANELKNVKWDNQPTWSELVKLASEMIKAGFKTLKTKAKKISKADQGYNLIKDLEITTRSQMNQALTSYNFSSNGATFNKIVKMYEENNGVDLGLKAKAKIKLVNVAWQLRADEVVSMLKNVTDTNKAILWKVFNLKKSGEKFQTTNFNFQPLFDFTYNR